MVTARDTALVSAEHRLQELGIELPAAPTPFGTYVEARRAGNLVFLTGMLPVIDHKPKYIGRVGKEIDAEAARDATRIAALGALAAARELLGSLDRIRRVVRFSLFIATHGDFFDQPPVADAASDLFRDIFGAGNVPARLILGVASLPLGVPIELEVIFEATSEHPEE
jgi:enamine deaminase RidA (YjgF/YER057c/UK114 family)